MASKGKASGFPMASYRPEAYGIWSVALAIVRLLECFSRDPANALRILCGNKGLASRIIEIMAQERPGFPNGTLAAGWGIINEVIALLRKYGIESLQWAKARQDEKIKWEKLPLPARLSCRAGKLAEEARQAHPAQFEALRAQSNAAQAHIGSKAISSKLKPSIRRAAQAPKILKYICHLSSWSGNTFHMADWEAHKAAVLPSQLPGRFVSKLISGLLPFGKRVKRYQECYLPQCLPCPAEAGVAPADPETQDHFFQCRCPRRRGMLIP